MTKKISAIIQLWYSENKRDLPWRNYKDAYTIWLSEIVLQQTRVKQGLPYFLKFKKEFPSIEDLAQAPIDQVLKMWQGLGYYSRAKNMHSTAVFIEKELNGKFPESFDKIMKLKGVGEYTASAIASIAYKHANAVVDGNVIRVLSRYFGVEDAYDIQPGRGIIKQIAMDQLDAVNPGNYNQALMEFGSLQCRPNKPDCNSCPLHHDCYAFTNNRVQVLPFKSKKTAVHAINYHFAVVRSKGKTYMSQRDETGIWNSLFQFPLLESKATKITINNILLSIKDKGLELNDFKLQSVVNINHVLSHRKISATFWEIDSENVSINANSAIFEMELDLINKRLAIPRLIEKYLDYKSDQNVY
jgi:A/G-specific adenine glycosylase